MNKIKKKLVIINTLMMVLISNLLIGGVSALGNFEVTTPNEVPSFYELKDDEKQLYSFMNKAEETLYRIHGMLNEDDEGFYVADSEGNLDSSLTKVNLKDDEANMYKEDGRVTPRSNHAFRVQSDGIGPDYDYVKEEFFIYEFSTYIDFGFFDAGKAYYYEWKLAEITDEDGIFIGQSDPFAYVYDENNFNRIDLKTIVPGGLESNKQYRLAVSVRWAPEEFIDPPKELLGIDTFTVNINYEEIEAKVTVNQYENPNEIHVWAEDGKDISRDDADVSWVIKNSSNVVVASGKGDTVTQDVINNLPVGSYTVTNTSHDETKYYQQDLDDQVSEPFIITGGALEVNYIMLNLDGSIDYVHENSYTERGKSGESWSCSKMLPRPLMYNLVKGPVDENGNTKSESGVYSTNSLDKVYYYYAPVSIPLTVEYIDEDGNELAEKVSEVGKYGDSYTTEKKAIPGYVFKEMHNKSHPANGTYDNPNEISVIYVYKKAPSKVIVHHVDEDGKKLIDDETINGLYSDPYTTKEKTITGYTLVKESYPANATGNFAVETTEVTYVYSKNPSKVIVHHVDEDGNELASDETIDGFYSDPYETKEKTIPGYNLVKESYPANASGSFAVNTTEVIYVYTKAPSKIIVHHVDKDGISLATDETMNGFYSDPYETSPKDITGYELLLPAYPTNAKGNYAVETIEVTYVYVKVASKVIVHHVDEYGNELADDETMNGFYSDPYITSEKTIPGYNLVDSKYPTNATGNFVVETTEVTYVYTKAPSKVIVHHVDEEGNRLSSDETIDGFYSNPYETKEKTIPGYNLVDSKYPTNATGTFAVETTEVIYVYTKAPSKVIVHHVDKDGNELADDETMNGFYSDPYITSEKTIIGYNLVEELYPTNATGTFAVETTEVIYVYTKASSKVIIHHVDEDGNELADDETIDGFYSDPYITSEKTIIGYNLVESKYPANATGTFAVETTEVIYVYTKAPSKVIVHYVDEDGDPLVDEDNIDGFYSDPYTTAPKEIHGYNLIEELYPNNAEGVFAVETTDVIYVYTKAPSEVIVHHVDEDGNKLVTDETLDGFYSDSYTTSEKEIPGYTLVQSKYPENANGTFAVEKTEVTYVYTKNPSKVIVQHVDEEGHKLAADETLDGFYSNPYTTNEKEIDGYKLIEELYPDNAKGLFDIDTIIVIYVYRLIPIEKLDVEKAVDKDRVEPGDLLTYTITVKNTGNQKLYRVRVRDYIPEYTLFEKVYNDGEYGVVDGKEHVTWFIEELEVGEELELKFSVTVDECIPNNHVVENTALYEVTGNTEKPDVNDPRNPELKTNTVGTSTSEVLGEDLVLDKENDLNNKDIKTSDDTTVFETIYLGLISFITIIYLTVKRKKESYK